ncbi:hypothetical protein KCU65_g3322, partial [Aureobasidium melanogenum]
MSFSSNHWPFDGSSFNFSPWSRNQNPDDHSQPHQQPTNPPNPSYQYPPPQHSASSSSSYPRLPLPNFTQSRHHSTAAQSRPQQHSTPSASLHAALREGADFLRPSVVPRLPQLSRPNSASSQQSSFGYIPNHFFYSPPQSPQEPDLPHHTANGTLGYQPATSSSAQPFAGPSFTNHTVGSSISNPLSHPQSTGHTAPVEPTTSAFRSGQSQSHYQNSAIQQHVKEEDPTAMPAPTASAINSRKRAHPSDPGSPPSATKRRLNSASALIEIDDSDEDEIEELGPDNDILAKEREALVTKQREESNKVSRIGELNCMICLEHFTNMTATHCGHIFCHECLTQALIASNSDHNYGTCPACRKPIKPKGKTQIVPLTLMKARKK